MPPEGEDVEYEEDITSEVQELAQEAAARLAAKNGKGKVRAAPSGSPCVLTKYRELGFDCADGSFTTKPKWQHWIHIPQGVKLV